MRLTAMYEDRASMFAPNEPVHTGVQNIRSFVAPVLTSPGHVVHICSPQQVDVSAGGDLGYAVIAYDESFVKPNGQEVNDHGREVVVWRKQSDGLWKVVIDIWNSDVPASR